MEERIGCYIELYEPTVKEAVLILIVVEERIGSSAEDLAAKVDA